VDLDGSGVQESRAESDSSEETDEDAAVKAITEDTEEENS
jgi:hypothetical protein